MWIPISKVRHNLWKFAEHRYLDLNPGPIDLETPSLPLGHGFTQWKTGHHSVKVKMIVKTTFKKIEKQKIVSVSESSLLSRYWANNELQENLKRLKTR